MCAYFTGTTTILCHRKIAITFIFCWSLVSALRIVSRLSPGPQREISASPVSRTAIHSDNMIKVQQTSGVWKLLSLSMWSGGLPNGSSLSKPCKFNVLDNQTWAGCRYVCRCGYSFTEFMEPDCTICLWNVLMFLPCPGNVHSTVRWSCRCCSPRIWSMPESCVLLDPR